MKFAKQTPEQENVEAIVGTALILLFMTMAIVIFYMAH